MPMKPHSVLWDQVHIKSSFASLVICVTETRKQVMEATQRLGGQYSPNLHPQCTHLVVQFEHALKHGTKNSLFIVTLGWLVSGGMIEESHLWLSGREFSTSVDSSLSGHFMYVDPDISAELRNKVVEAATREGAKVVEKWFAGCNASHVVCEGTSVQRYLGYSTTLSRMENINVPDRNWRVLYVITLLTMKVICVSVTVGNIDIPGRNHRPLWVLKTAKDKYVRRLVHMSTDLARQISMLIEDSQKGIARKKNTKPY
ncbi:hypothetical protein I3760_12G008200 [Carya illinoinensis]|nr:hypothetical protein I3760_12G008200 [Carya illinoinensis]